MTRRLRTFAQPMSVAVLGIMLGAPAGAQAFNFSTTGFFLGANGPNVLPGCSATVPTPVATCDFGNGLVLTFTGVSPAPSGYAFGSTVSFGTFTTSGVGTVEPGDLSFRLLIEQTQPVVGTGRFDGGIRGTLIRDPVSGNFSTFVLIGMARTTMIGGTTYQLFLDQGTDGVGILANGATVLRGTALGGNPPSVVPEPATLGLTASGLGLLALAGWRRHRVA